MSDFFFNIGKGRIVELYNRVKSNDPVNSAFVLIPVNVGAVTDATIKDLDTFADVITAGVVERATNGWTRKILTDVELPALSAPDDTNDRYAVGAGIASLTWTAVLAGNDTTDLILCYDSDTTTGGNVNLIPVAQFDFPITTDGTDVQVNVNTAGLAYAA